MQQLIQHLQQARVLFISTLSKTGQPSVRPIALAAVEKQQLFFCTSRQRGLYQDISHCSAVELSAINQSEPIVWCRISGRMIETDKLDIKEKVINNSTFVKNYFKTAKNPDLVLFQLTDISAAMLDYSGRAPRIIYAEN